MTAWNFWGRGAWRLGSLFAALVLVGCGGSGKPGADAGTYSCDTGWYDHDQNATTPCVPWRTCAAGTYVETEGTAAEDRVCTACATGTFSTGNNAAQCTAWKTCAAGEYVTTSGTVAYDRVCAACASGTFSATGNAVSCQAWTSCPAGSHVANTPSASADRTCTACTAGTFTAAANEAQCQAHTPCAAGTEQQTAGTATAQPVCQACAAGTYCAGGTATAAACDAASWDHDQSAATACVARTTCAAGTRVTSDGSATADRTCQACGTGEFSTQSNASSCAAWTNCAAGNYVSTAGSASADRVCTACGSGTFSTATNASSCQAHTVCAAGEVQTAAGTATADTTCAACTAGNFCAGGTASQVACTGDTWDHDGSAATDCQAKTRCVAGQYVAGSGSATTDRTCSSCGTGTYSDTANASTCTTWSVCQAGTYMVAAGTSITDRTCTACAAGTYSDTTNVTTCTTCTAGTYCATGATSPVACGSANWDHDGDAATDCQAHTVCAAGQYVTSAGTATTDQTCDPCAAGTYSDTTNVTTCTTCTPGTYCASGATSPVACGSGTNNFDDDSNAATACLAMKTCVEGRFVSVAGSPTTDRECTDCPAGEFSTTQNAASCQQHAVCVAGQYVTGAGTATTDQTCDPCAAGTYSDTTNVTTCTTCTPGTYCASGATAEVACGSGTNDFDDDSNAATACVAMTNCATGQYVSTVGTPTTDRACTACAAGTYSDTTNVTACTACTAGTYCASGATSPVACGSSSNDFDLDSDPATACVAMMTCVAGKYVSDVGNATTDRTCTACAAGTYSDTTNVTACTACTAGTYCASGATAEVACGSGTNDFDDDSNAATACVAMTNCVAGQYVSTVGTATTNRVCTACAAGFFTTAQNAGSCQAHTICAAGQYVTGAGTLTTDQTCGACAAGTYSDTTNAAACTACGSGSFSASGATACTPWTDCLPPPDEFIDVDGTATADRTCRAGWREQFGTASSEQVLGLVMEPGGQVVVVGWTTGALTAQPNFGGRDAFVRRYNTDGTTAWTQQFGTVGDDEALDVGVDANGNIYVAGFVTGALQGTALGLQDAFVRAYDTTGLVLWTRQFGTPQNDRALGIGVDPGGASYAVGVTAGGLAIPTSLGGDDAFVVKVRANGTIGWQNQFGTAGADQANDAVVDAAGAVIVVGGTTGALFLPSSVGGRDAFVSRHKGGNGDVTFTTQFGTTQDDELLGVAADATHYYVAGYAKGALGTTGLGAFVRSYLAADNTVSWTTQFGATVDDVARSPTVTTAGVYVCGATRVQLGDDDAFAVRLPAAGGAPSWTWQFGTAANDRANACGADASGANLAIGGMTSGVLPGATSAGLDDGFVLRTTP